MKFSVLISVYYKEEPVYFEQCIDSILNQTLMPTEILLIKDGPLTDELELVIQRYIDMNPNLFKVIPLEMNVGLGKALAIGVEKCSYDLIARMDTDDIAAVDRFEKQIKVFQENPCLDMIGSHIIEFQDNIENVISKRKVPLENNDIISYSKRRNPFNHVTVMFKKVSVLKAGNYRKVSGLGYEDYDLWIRMLINGCCMKNIDDYLVFVRVGDDMYKRRANKERLRTALHFRRNLHKINYISFRDLIVSSAGNILMAYLPNKMRELLYKKVLRKNG